MGFAHWCNWGLEWQPSKRTLLTHLFRCLFDGERFMLLTTTTFLILLGVSVLSVALGLFGKKNELYILGVVLLLFTGLWTLQEGISEPVGSVANETGNITLTTTTYEATSTVWGNGFGLLMVVVAAGLGLNFVRNRSEEKREKMESVDEE